MKYTIETIEKLNERFIRTNGKLNELDLSKANRIICLLEKERKDNFPKIGDIVKFTDEYGNYYKNAIVREIDNDKVYISENASIYVYDDKKLSFSISGGAVHNTNIKNLIHYGKDEREFWTFGHCGACKDGGIYFNAKVNVWECNLNKYKFSTKTHNRYFLQYSEEKDEFGYRFILKDFSCRNSFAFRNEKEFQKWFWTFRGEVEDFDLHTVWTYKEVEHHVSPEEYEKMNIFEDTFLMNGRIRRCKRIYDDKNFLIHTYFVWYWKDDEKDFCKKMEKQNKAIKEYVTDFMTIYCRAEYDFMKGKAKPIKIVEKLKNGSL